ncbi:MAG: heparinase II/III family protein [Lachnospiraceae bacterium]
MFKEFVENNRALRFSDLSLYAPAKDRPSWESLDDAAKDFVVNEARNYLHYDYPYLKATDFMEFCRTGNRTHYEDKLFAKRKALSALVLGECVEYKKSFLDDIINGIYAICDETCWQLPAHNSYIRDTPQLLLPDTQSPIIELFSCETAAILSTACYLLLDELNEVSPLIVKRVYAEIKKRVLDVYLTEHFWWMGHGDEPMCNWTIWCTQNILITAFSIPLTNEMRTQIVQKACASCDYFLKDYGDDGCCEEGAQYYRHAGLCLFQTILVLCNVSNNHFAALWNNPKVKNIASYILNVHVDDIYYINFADCSPVAGRASSREFLFGKYCNIPSLSAFAAKDYRKKNMPENIEENNLFYRLQELMTRSQMLNYKIPDYIEHPNIYYDSVGLFIARNHTYTVGVKAGDNADSHNHNDTGSITFYKNGLPFLVDIGVESYTRKTFSPQRYEIWTMQSDYHNLPTLNGLMQQDGKDYYAEVLGNEFTKEGGQIKMELKNAYPKDAKIRSYKRNVLLTNQGLTLTDEWNLSNSDHSLSPVILNLISYNTPEITSWNGTDGRISLKDLGMIEITSGQRLEVLIEELPITDPRLMLCWKHSLYRIRICFNDSVGSCNLTVR